MSIIRTMLARPLGTSPRDDRRVPPPTTMAILVGGGDIPSQNSILGSITRTGLLWKNAELALATTGGLITARGMPSVMSTLAAHFPNARMRVAVPIHEGYVALYGPDGLVAARVLENEAGLNVRIMDPHVAYLSQGPLCHVIEGAFRQLENERDRRA